MKELQDYLTSGLRKIFRETSINLRDMIILTKRVYGLSEYDIKNIGDMTSKEYKNYCFDSKSLHFKDKDEFNEYLSKNQWPIGPSTIGYGENAERIDDTIITLSPLSKPKLNLESKLNNRLKFD